MAKYRKKPVIIEAVQWTEANREAIKAFAYPQAILMWKNRPESLCIGTLEGDMKASKGDFIIKGVKGELYPCKPDIFEATYELVEEEK